MKTTTLNKIRNYGPCSTGWEKLLGNLNKTKPDDEPLTISDIIQSNGLDDAAWCLRAFDLEPIILRRFAIFCAKQVQHLMKDKRSVDAVNAAERYLGGEIDRDQVLAAADAATAAAADAATYAVAATAAAADAATYAAAAAAAAADAADAVSKKIIHEMIRICSE